MSFVKTRDGVEIFYKDWGSGQPLVFHHGWPLSSDDWDAQLMFFLAKGFRVIAHDRRGHGRSSQTLVPFADAAPLSSKLLKRGTLKVYEGLGHGLCTLNADVVNADLLAFIQS